MNVAGFGDTAGEQDAFSTQLERLGNILAVLHAGTAQHPYVRVHSLDGCHGIAYDGRVGGGDGDVAADEFGGSTAM